MRGWVHRDRDVGRHSNGLVDGTTMGYLQQPFLLFGRDPMGEMNTDINPTDTMGAFGHRPFHINCQTLSSNAVPPAKLTDKIPHATGYRPDKEFNRAHAGILPSILDRLVGNDPMLAADNVITRSTMKGGCEFHAVSPGHVIPLPDANTICVRPAFHYQYGTSTDLPPFGQS